MAVFADRVFRYHMPLGVLFLELTERRSGWLRLQPGEVVPRVLEAAADRVVWSSFWPVSPDDVIELDLSAEPPATSFGRQRSLLRMRWRSNSPPDARGIGITRQRLARKFGADFRGVDTAYW